MDYGIITIMKRTHQCIAVPSIDGCYECVSACVCERVCLRLYILAFAIYKYKSHKYVFHTQCYTVASTVIATVTVKRAHCMYNNNNDDCWVVGTADICVCVCAMCRFDSASHRIAAEHAEQHSTMHTLRTWNTKSKPLKEIYTLSDVARTVRERCLRQCLCTLLHVIQTKYTLALSRQPPVPASPSPVPSISHPHTARGTPKRSTSCGGTRHRVAGTEHGTRTRTRRRRHSAQKAMHVYGRTKYVST